MATENAVMTYNDAGYQLPLTISGSGSYNYLLRTKDTYLNKDITITTSTAAAVPEADNANADVTLFTTDGSNAGVNISSIVGTKATAEPTSGYYLAFKGSGRSKITTAGWIGTGALNTSTSDAKYFPITAANGSITKVNQSLTPTASLEKSNTLTWSDSDTSGISVTAKGNASGSLSARIDISQAGYVPSGNNWKSGSLTISAAGTPASAIKYLTAVDIASGKSFTVTNAGTLTVTSTGTTTVTSNSTSAGTVTIAAKKTSDASANTSVQVIASGLLSFKTVSFEGQTLTNTNYSKTDLAVSFASGSDTNMSNITYGAKDTTNYPFYYKISGSTPAVSGTTTVSIGAVTYSNDLGLVDAHSGATALNATSSSPTVSVNAGAGSTYIKIKKITVGTKINGSDGTVTPVIKRTALPDGDQWTDAANGAEVSTKPSSGVYVQVDAQAVAKSFSVEGTVTSSGYGTADSGTTAGTYTKATAQSITAGSTSAATKWIPIKTTSVTFTAGALNNKTATIKTQTNVVANSTNNSGVTIVLQGTAGCSSSTYTNTAGWLDAHSNTTTNTAISKQTWDGTTYYINSVDIIANKTFTVTSNAGTVNVTNSGTVNVTNSGTTTVTSNSTSAGTIAINAKVTVDDNNTTNANVVENGLWKTVSMAAANTAYYGRVTASALTITTSSTNDGMSTYFNTGSSSDKNVTITPKYTNTAGFKTETTTATNNGGTTYWKIKTVTPTFAAAPSGGSTASSSQVTMDTTSTSAGIEIQTAYTINAATITYKAAATGWIDKAKDASTGSSTTAKSSTNGTKYYVTGITVPASKSLAIANSGTVTVTSGSTSAGTVTIVAKKTANDSSNTTANVITNGLWQQATIKSPDTTATLGNPTYQTSGTNSGKFIILASGTIAEPTVDPAGYVNGDDTIGTRQTGAISGTKVLNKVELKATSSSTLTYKPAIKRQTPASGETWTDASSGAETTPSSVPTSGVYVKVKSQAATGTITVTPAVKTDGYGTTSYYTSNNYTGTIGAQASADTYIPIQTGSAAVTASQSITKNPDISFPASGTLRATYSGSKSITGTVSTAGWITSVTAATVTTSGTKDVTSLALPATYNFTLTTTAGASGDNTGFTITNNAYRKITITNNANGTTTVTNSGTVTVTNSGTTTVTSGIASSTPKGTINVNAYPTSGTTLDGSKKIVENGRWITTSVSAGGTYYGKVTIGTASFNNTATSGVSYADYDANAPIIPSGGYLYINAGYTPARKISLAKLVPNEVTVGETVEDPLIHPTCTAYNVKGEVVVGTMVIYGGDYTITT